MIVIFFLLAQNVFSRAPLLSQQETVDRVLNGVSQRSYLVRFNEKAPLFGMNMDKLSDWMHSILVEEQPHMEIQRIYEITENFRGYALWAGPSLLEFILDHESTQYVEEDSVVRSLAPFTARPDWGQVRAAQKGSCPLLTIPPNLYNTSYPNAGDPTTTWDWTTDMYQRYQRINNGSNAAIWVVDTGIRQTHQEFINPLDGRSRVAINRDFVDTNGTGTDCNGHGTHCAGTAAGLYRGLATSAVIGNVRVLACSGSGTNANVIAGFNYVADSQVAGKTNIISASIGGGFSQTMNDAVRNAVSKGVVVVVPAGGSNANACDFSPSSAPDAITVSSTDRNDARVSSVNTGPCVKVFAPGQNIHSAWYTSDTIYNTLSGSSMSAPLTAGAIALYATQFSSPVSAQNVSNAITTYGTKNLVTGNLLAGTPNVIINANWN